MNYIYRTLAVTSLALFALTACDNKGPAERAGEKIDNAAEHTKDSVDSAMDKAEDKIDHAGDKIRDKTD